jgi:hypothetical protein
MSATLAAVASLTALTAAVLANAGRLALRRLPAGQGRLAGIAFGSFWIAGGAAVGLQSLRAWIVLAGLSSDDVQQTLLDVGAFPLVVALFSVVYYLSYLYLGRRRAYVPLAFAYGAFLAFTLYVYHALGPWHATVADWDVVLAPAHPNPPLLLAFGLLFSVPVLVSTVLYASLWRRASRGEPRYRVAMVSGAFLVLFGAILAGFVMGLEDKPWYPMLYDAPGFVAALLVQAAFAPPATVRRRLGILPA